MKGTGRSVQPRRLLHLWLRLAVMFLVPVVSVAVGAAERAPVERTGTITGVVKFVGPLPPVQKFTVTFDTARCGKERWPQDLIVGPNRGVQYAVVSLNGIRRRAERPPKRPELDQVDCEFIPRVVIIPVSTTLTVYNTDDLLHTFHTISTKNPPLNRAQPGIRKILYERFHHPEIVTVTCSRHPWMKAWIVVTEHPYYAITDDSGAFTLADVPVGTYPLKVWHETLGEVRKEVTVNPGAETKVTLKLMKK